MKYNWLFIVLATAILAQQCAKQTAPTGGPKDMIPPQLESSRPKNKGVNFKGTEVELTFDELLQLNNPREQIIITPSIGKKFEATVKKNKVTLEFNSKLQENTTYNINFRESIQDLTEKNPAKAKLAFSTGTYIDSLSVTGFVTDILTDQKVKNYTVALVEVIDTFNIFKHPATWIGLTDDKGKFLIENLKPGNYFLYTFDDRSKNLIVDGKTEKYGFQTEALNLTGKLDSVKLSVVKLDISNLKLISARPTFAYFDIRLSKSLIDYKITSEAGSLLYSALQPDLTTVKVYNTIPDLDSLQVRLQAEDSIGSKIDTLVFVKFSKKESTKDKFSTSIESATLDERKSILSSVITFSKPVLNFNSDSLYVQLDSVNRINFTKNDFLWNESLTKATIKKKLETKPKPKAPVSAPKKESSEGQKKEIENLLILAKGSAMSVENDSAARTTKSLKILVPEELSVIQTKVQTKEDFILQLIDKSYKVVEETRNSKTHIFENVLPGTYYMRALIDLNKNGKWDAGNYKAKTQPEPIVYYTNPKGGKDIFLKANWEVGDLLISYP
jgi:uncharacterized protein (DUF2141 family)